MSIEHDDTIETLAVLKETNQHRSAMLLITGILCAATIIFCTLIIKFTEWDLKTQQNNLDWEREKHLRNRVSEEQIAIDVMQQLKEKEKRNQSRSVIPVPSETSPRTGEQLVR